MRRAVGLAVLVGLGLGSALRGEEPVPKTAAALGPLIERLGDRDFRLRDAAQQALAELGVEVLPALRLARKDHDDPEVIRRLDILIPSLERSARLTPLRVHLHLDKRPIQEAFAELSRQTGYPIKVGTGGSKDKVYSFHLDGVTFWEAFDQVAEAGGLVCQRFGMDALAVGFTDKRVPFLHRDGLFRWTALRFDSWSSFYFGSLPRNPGAAEQRYGQLSLTLSVAVEPCLPLLQLGQVKVIQARDDLGNSMVTTREQFERRRFHTRNRSEGSLSLSTQVSLAWPSAQATSIKVIKGTVPVTLLVEKKPQIIVENIMNAEGKTFRAGGTELTVQNIKEEAAKDKECQIQLLVQEKSNPGDRITWAPSLPARLELQDGRGHKYVRWGCSWGSDGNGHHGEFQFRPGKDTVWPPAKLVLYTWIAIQHQAEFEFRNLPLP